MAREAISFAEAVRRFEAIQLRYAATGANDTEPSTTFAGLIRQLLDGQVPEVPVTIDGWQLFNDVEHVGLVSVMMTRAARIVIRAGLADPDGLAHYAKHELWRA